MSAFVPGAGIPLSSSRVFVTGTKIAVSSQKPQETQLVASPEISAFKIPLLPFDFKLPKLPNFPNFFSKKDSAPSTSTPPKKPMSSGKKPDLQVGGQVVKPVMRKDTKAKGHLAAGVPKFYNPKTSRAEFKATAKGQNSTAFDRRIQANEPSSNEYANSRDVFRNMDPYVDDIVWARPGWSSDEAALGVTIALKNIFGNSNLFESEVAEMKYSISCVTNSANMKEFIRAIGQSKAYNERFFAATNNTRFIECNFLHFLGRPPHNQEEVAEHIKIINEEGYNAEINSYVDSDEYDCLWGESRIPTVNFKGGYLYNNDMNKLAVLNSGVAKSDSVSKTPYLTTGDATGFTPYAILKGMPVAWRGENEARQQAGTVGEFSPDAFWNPQPSGLREAELAWIARFGSWQKFWYKDSICFKEIMTPNTAVTAEEEEYAQAVLKYGVNMADKYVGCRWSYDVAPVIEMRAPTSDAVGNGQLSVKMTEISFSIPSSLEQKV